MRTMKWLAALLALCLLPALSEGLDVEEEPVPAEEETVFIEAVDNAIEEEDFMLFSDEPINEGYAEFLSGEEEDNSGGIPIDAAHFPDDAFRAYVSGECDPNGNGKLSDKERKATTDIYVEDLEIGSLKGIEHFPNLKKLYCGYNRITSLDLSKNTKLVTLEAYTNRLSSLDLSQNTALKYLDCGRNRLTALDVRKNTALTGLVCQYNQIASLDVRKNKKLTSLYCGDNALTGLDLSKNANLDELSCEYNDISRLDLSGCGDALKQALLSGPAFEERDEGVLCLSEEVVLRFDDATALIVDGTTVFEGAPDRVRISNCQIAIKDKTWTGKELKPAPMVTYNGTTLVKDTDYTVEYANNQDVGLATVTVTGKGGYTGRTKVHFKVKPKSTTLSKVTPGKKKLTVTWKKQSKQVSGYQIQYGTKKDFSNAKKLTVKGAKTVKATIKGLKAKKTYYVRVRTYKTVSGVKYYSSWSKYKKIKTK